MKSKILAAVIAAASILTTQAFASPASYQDAAWSNFIEKKAGKVTPAGFPFGKGAVSRMRDGAVWPEPFLKLVAPTDMSKVEAIKLSNQAINAERTYASESMAAFLSASADKLKKLTKRKDIQLPVYMLAYRADDVPTPRLNDLLDVQIGVYLTGKSPVPAPDFATDGNSRLPTPKFLSGKDYQRYASQVLDKYDSLKPLSTRQLSQEMYDIFHTVDPTPSGLPRANQGSTDDASAEDSQIDLDTTWLMFEAMLTQTAETVMRIKLPGPLRTRLMSHAESAKRPAQIIEKFKDITIISQDNPVISVQIACSIRDRFLGCPVKGDEATEAKVTKIAQAIIDNAKSGSESDQLHAMQLVINARPKAVKNTMKHPESIQKAAAKALALPFDNRQTNESADPNAEIIANYKRICKRSNGERKQKGKGGKGKRNTRKPSTNRFYDEESLALPF